MKTILLPALRSLMFIAAGLLMLVIPPFRSENLEGVSKWWALVCIAVNLVTIATLMILIRRDGRKFRDIVGHVPGRLVKDVAIAVPVMLLLGMGGLMGFSWLVYGYMPVTSIQPVPLWAAITIICLLPVTIVFAEIPFYIGYCVPALQKKTGNKLIAYSVPLFFFALQHSFMPLLFDYRHILSRFLIFIPLLIFMGIWSHRRKDILPLMIGHGILDTAAAVQILIVSTNPAFFEMISPA